MKTSLTPRDLRSNVWKLLAGVGTEPDQERLRRQVMLRRYHHLSTRDQHANCRRRDGSKHRQRQRTNTAMGQHWSGKLASIIEKKRLPQAHSSVLSHPWAQRDHKMEDQNRTTSAIQLRFTAQLNVFQCRTNDDIRLNVATPYYKLLILQSIAIVPE